MTATQTRDFNARMPGRVWTPGTPEYARATTPRNASARQQPCAVVVAHSPEAVAGCLRAAAESGLSVVVQATGHGAAREVKDDCVLLDTSQLDAVSVDAQRRVVRAGAGAHIGAINRKAFAHGLLVLGGTAPDVGIAGYVAHGGVGWLARPYGLASASLLSASVVLGTGEQVVADEATNSDLLWAWRGGGGAGVATEVELRLFPAADLWAGYLLWPATQADMVVSAWGQALGRLHPGLTSALGLLRAPDSPAVPESLRGLHAVHLSVASVAGEEAVQTLRTVLSDVPEPAVDTLGPSDAERLSGIHFDPPTPVPAHGEGRWLTAEAGVRALEVLTAAGPDSPLALVELRHVAAPASDVPGAQTSCPGAVLLHATGATPDAGARRAVRAALDAVVAAARPADTGVGALAFRDGQERTTDALPPQVLDRLAKVRRQADPAGLLVPSQEPFEAAL